MSCINCRSGRPQHTPRIPFCPPPPCPFPQPGAPGCPPCNEMPICPPPCRVPPPCPPCPCPAPCPPGQASPIIACRGRETQRCMTETICVSGLPGDLCAPFTLQGLEVSQEQPTVNIRRHCGGPSPVVAEVTVPLIAWVCDAVGRTHCGVSQIVICVRMPSSCAACNGVFLANACVRLIETGCSRSGPVFDVRLEVMAEVFLILANPCANRSALCRFPQKPMFPQPCFPCW